MEGEVKTGAESTVTTIFCKSWTPLELPVFCWQK